MADYIISVRNLRKGQFGAEPGPVRFLKVPDTALPEPDHRITRKLWVDDVMAAAHHPVDPNTGQGCGDIAVLIHGYATSPAEVVLRHRHFSTSLATAGFRGVVVSFDWPSDDYAINYLEDRVDAKLTALKLVDDGIALLAATQFRGCQINVHVIAHSMGAYVLREAFDDADDRPAIAASNWTVSQVCLVGADISAASLAADDARSRSLYRHCTRLTNYQNPYDSVLKLSDIKRVGVAPRAGRRGLPADAPEKAVNVNCGEHFSRQFGDNRSNGHSWYFDDALFYEDLAGTLAGDLDRRVIARRRIDSLGAVHLA